MCNVYSARKQAGDRAHTKHVVCEVGGGELTCLQKRLRRPLKGTLLGIKIAVQSDGEQQPKSHRWCQLVSRVAEVEKQEWFCSKAADFQRHERLQRDEGGQDAAEGVVVL